MIHNKLIDDISTVLPNLPVQPVYLLNANRGLYYDVVQDEVTGDKELRWTAHDRPSRYPFLAFQVERAEMFWEKSVVNVTTNFEYASFTDLVNSNKEFIQDEGMLTITTLVNLLYNKRCYTKIQDRIFFTFFEQIHDELATTVFARVDIQVNLDRLQQSMCCFNKVTDITP